MRWPGLWINGLLLLYALLVFFSRRNFDSILQSLLLSLQNQFGEQITKKGQGTLLNALKKAKIPWDKALSQSTMPFITPPGSFRIYIKSQEKLKQLIPLELLAESLKKN